MGKTGILQKGTTCVHASIVFRTEAIQFFKEKGTIAATSALYPGKFQNKGKKGSERDKIEGFSTPAPRQKLRWKRQNVNALPTT